jgi:hypothetical protein
MNRKFNFEVTYLPRREHMTSFIIICVLFCGCSPPLSEKSSSDDSARKASLADISIEIVQARTTNEEQPFPRPEVGWILDIAPSGRQTLTAIYKSVKRLPPQGSVFLIVTSRVAGPQDKWVELSDRDLVLVDDLTGHAYEGFFWMENARTNKGLESLWGDLGDLHLEAKYKTGAERNMLFTVPVESMRTVKIRFLDRQAVPLTIE